MDTKENLLESDGRFPSLFLVEDRKADGARRVDIGVEQRRDEFALGGLRGIFIWKSDVQLELAALPDCVFLARNSTLPDLHVQHTLGVLLGFGPEAERVVFPPLLSLLNQTVLAECRTHGDDIRWIW